jgi:hypothetical protein
MKVAMIAAAAIVALAGSAEARPLPMLQTYDTCARVGHTPECEASEADIKRSLYRIVQPLWDEADDALQAKCAAKTDKMADMIQCLEGH